MSRLARRLVDPALNAWRTIAISLDVLVLLLLGSGNVWNMSFVAGYAMLAVANHWAYRITLAARRRAITRSRAAWKVPYRAWSA